ncbi:MAG: hypothetical protein RIR69_206 [Actinomycetota bacterium]|jgi:hypothetical protein
MAKTRSAARRTNRALAALVLVVGCVSAGAAVSQYNRDDPPVDIEESIGVTAPADTNGKRPAEVGLSWFNHGFGTEQIDFDMPSLSCRSLSESITPDLCAVANTSYGDFMVAATEGFWDVSEFDDDGTTWVPLDFTVFVMRDDLAGTRALSVLDGSTEKAFTALPVSVDLYIARIASKDVIIIHQYLADEQQDAFAFKDSVQVISMSATGAPSVVATYEGHQLRIASSGSSLELSSLRYRSSNSNPNPQWFTRISVLPGNASGVPYLWNELVTSNDEQVPNGEGMKLAGSYTFPIRGPITSDL